MNFKALAFLSPLNLYNPYIHLWESFKYQAEIQRKIRKWDWTITIFLAERFTRLKLAKWFHNIDFCYFLPRDKGKKMSNKNELFYCTHGLTSGKVKQSINTCMHNYIYISVCVCIYMCVCVYIHTHTHAHTYIYLYIYIYIWLPWWLSW